MNSPGRSVLITGAGGYIGSQLVERLAGQPEEFRVIPLDVREIPSEHRLPGVEYVTADIRDPRLAELCRQYRVDTVVHLASIVSPGRRRDRQHEYSVDVEGTSNVLAACVAAEVRQIILTSSGAAYGYYLDNPQRIDEDQPLRGNSEFAYAHHKRLIEEMLAGYRRDYPQLCQLIFRPGTVLGAHTNNQITDLFHKRFVLGIRGAPSPWVFIWDEDVVECILKGIRERATGVYNLAGDGTLTMQQVAERLGKPFLPLPAWLLRAGLALLRPLGITQYGPEQVDFLRYRPVLSNARLKDWFGYAPRKSTAEVLDYYLSQQSESR